MSKNKQPIPSNKKPRTQAKQSCNYDATKQHFVYDAYFAFFDSEFRVNDTKKGVLKRIDSCVIGADNIYIVVKTGNLRGQCLKIQIKSCSPKQTYINYDETTSVCVEDSEIKEIDCQVGVIKNNHHPQKNKIENIDGNKDLAIVGIKFKPQNDDTLQEWREKMEGNLMAYYLEITTAATPTVYSWIPAVKIPPYQNAKTESSEKSIFLNSADAAFKVYPCLCNKLKLDYLMPNDFSFIGLSTSYFAEARKFDFKRYFNYYEINNCKRIAHFFGQTNAESAFSKFTEEMWGSDSKRIDMHFRSYEPYKDNVESEIITEDGKQIEKFKTRDKDYKLLDDIKEPNDYGYDVSRKLGNTCKGDGKKFCGRGLIQVTGKTNYINYFEHLFNNKEDLEFIDLFENLRIEHIKDNSCDDNTFVNKNYKLLENYPHNLISALNYWRNKESSGFSNLNIAADNDNFYLITLHINGGLNGVRHRRLNTKKILNKLKYCSEGNKVDFKKVNNDTAKFNFSKDIRMENDYHFEDAVFAYNNGSFLKLNKWRKAVLNANEETNEKKLNYNNGRFSKEQIEKIKENKYLSSDYNDFNPNLA